MNKTLLKLLTKDLAIEVLNEEIKAEYATISPVQQKVMT